MSEHVQTGIDFERVRQRIFGAQRGDLRVHVNDVQWIRGGGFVSALECSIVRSPELIFQFVVLPDGEISLTPTIPLECQPIFTAALLAVWEQAS